MFNGTVLKNNSNILISDIGDTPSGSLRCYSDRDDCCYSASQRGFLEQWRFPNRSVVHVENSSILVTRENGYLGLSRVDNVTTPAAGGQYCCEAQDARGRSSTVCVNIQSQYFCYCLYIIYSFEQNHDNITVYCMLSHLFIICYLDVHDRVDIATVVPSSTY